MNDELRLDCLFSVNIYTLQNVQKTYELLGHVATAFAIVHSWLYQNILFRMHNFKSNKMPHFNYALKSLYVHCATVFTICGIIISFARTMRQFTGTMS